MIGDYYDTTEAARELGISRSGVLKLINRGRLQTSMVGRDHLIHRDEINRLRNRPMGRPRLHSGYAYKRQSAPDPADPARALA